jgi:hypothetical protein
MVLLLASVTVFQRFGLSFGSVSVSVGLLAVYLCLALAAAAGVLVVSAKRLLLYSFGVCIAVTSTAVNDGLTSMPSLLLLLVMYLPFVCLFEREVLAESDASWLMSRFLDIALLSAVAGICQFAAQFVVHGSWLFDYTPLIPPWLRATGSFNTVIPIGSLFKSNGFFYREPSGFSFIMALALLAESVTHRRVVRVLCFGLALLLTYSGTGLLALLIGTLHPFGGKTLLRLLLLGCVGSLAFWLFGDWLNLSFTLGRVNEFNSTQSSGYIRYIAPMRLLADMFFTNGWTPWIGHGAGTISRTVVSYSFHDPTWAKLIFEYGLLGFTAFVALFLVCLKRPGMPPQLRGALFWGWLIMGGHLLSVEQNFLMLALVGLLPAESTLAAKCARSHFAAKCARSHFAARHVPLSLESAG